MRTVRCSIFTCPSLARESLLPVSETPVRKNNRLTGKEICKVTWRFRKSVLIRSIPAIPANLVVLAMHVVLAILEVPTTANVGVPTKLPKMKKMTHAIHISLDNLDFATPGLIEVVRSMVVVEIVHLQKCRNCVYLPCTIPGVCQHLVVSHV